MSLLGAVRSRFERWLDKRIPATSSMTLGHRSIFIVPSRSCWMYVLLLTVLLATAINYQNSLMYALTFWLFSVALAGMIFSFRNVSGLQLKVRQPNACFVGDRVELPVVLQSAGRYHEGISLHFPDEIGFEHTIAPLKTETIFLSYRTKKRGPLEVDRIRLDSRFPIGLFSVWSWVKLDFRGVVYPKPETTPFIFSAAADGNELEGAPSQESGQQDFYGLRPYQVGDSLKRIAWKQLARGKGLVSKEFDHDASASCWLEWDVLAPLPIETRLSRLCGWVLQAHEHGWRYGLKIPGAQIEPDYSEAHLEKCLTALALFGYEAKP